MATAFNDREREQIVHLLRDAARKCASSTGMRKTTVDELAAQAGISKGAFYKFYESKEHLFLDMIEAWYREIYDRAEQVLMDNAALPEKQRASLAFREAVRLMQDKPLIRFIEEEVPLMLRKLPEQLVKEHYLSVEEFIHSVIHNAHLVLTVPDDVAEAAIRIIFMSLTCVDKIGPCYGEAVEQLIDSACQYMIQA